MKFLRLIIISLLTIIITLLIIASLYVKLFAKQLLEDAVFKLSGNKLYIQSLNYAFPLGFNAINIRLSDAATADRVEMQLYPESFWGSQWHVKEIFITNFNVYYKQASLDSSLVDLGQKSVIEPGDPFTAELKKYPNIERRIVKPVLIDQLQFSSGEVKYSNDLIKKDFFLLIKDIWLNIEKCQLPLSGQPVYYQFKGNISDSSLPFKDFSMQSNGWVDFVGRNMSGEAHVLYTQESKDISMIIISENNSMKIRGNFIVDDVLAQLLNLGLFDMDSEVVSQVASKAGFGVDGQFLIETKFDDFKIEKIKFFGDVIQYFPQEEKVAP